MESQTTQRGRRLFPWVAALLVTLSALAPSAVLAQTDDEESFLYPLDSVEDYDRGEIEPSPPPEDGEEPDDPSPAELTDGRWVGSAVIVGPATIPGDGFTFTWDGRQDLVFLIDVEDGVVGGEVRIDGNSTTALESEVLGPGRGTHVETGSGTLEGSAGEFTVTGEVTDRSEFTAAGNTFSGVDTTEVTVDIEIVYADCTEAYGTFIEQVNAVAAAGGFTRTLSGDFVATREVDAVDAAIEAWKEASEPGISQGERVEFDFDADTFGKVPPALARYLQGISDLAADFNVWAQRMNDAEEWLYTLWFEAEPLIDAMERLVNELRNLSECDRDLLEQFAPRYLTWPANTIERLVDVFALASEVADKNEPIPPGRLIAKLALAATRAGILGRSGNEAKLQGVTEASLEVESRRLDGQDRDDGGTCFRGSPCLPSNPDTIAGLQLGAQMGWDFQIGEVTVDPVSVLARVNGRAGG